MANWYSRINIPIKQKNGTSLIKPNNINTKVALGFLWQLSLVLRNISDYNIENLPNNAIWTCTNASNGDSSPNASNYWTKSGYDNTETAMKSGAYIILSNTAIGDRKVVLGAEDITGDDGSYSACGINFLDYSLASVGSAGNTLETFVPSNITTYSGSEVETNNLSGYPGFKVGLASPDASTNRFGYTPSNYEFKAKTEETSSENENNYLHVSVSEYGEFIALLTSKDSSQVPHVKYILAYLKNRGPDGTYTHSFCRDFTQTNPALYYPNYYTMISAPSLSSSENTFSTGLNYGSLSSGLLWNSALLGTYYSYLNNYASIRTVGATNYAAPNSVVHDALFLTYGLYTTNLPDNTTETLEEYYGSGLQPISSITSRDLNSSTMVYPAMVYQYNISGRKGTNTIPTKASQRRAVGYLPDIYLTTNGLQSCEPVKYNNQWYTVVGNMLLPMRTSKKLKTS